MSLLMNSEHHTVGAMGETAHEAEDLGLMAPSQKKRTCK